MKIRVLALLLIIGVGLFTNCDDNDDPQQLNTLDGTWKLVQSTSSFGDNHIFDDILVSYTFDSSNNKLTVVNFAIENTEPGPKPSGRLANGIEYSYDVLENAEISYLKVESQNSGQMELGSITFDQEDTFILNQTELSSGVENSEFILTFEKIE
jgi:hypothetical protein